MSLGRGVFVSYLVQNFGDVHGSFVESTETSSSSELHCLLFAFEASIGDNNRSSIRRGLGGSV